ncbi:MAG TPA: UDP-N-acetylmuramoyl-tripeptide--D-alanyl-D-alanine ligase [Candidatus Polarisedimenticolia bacterium]|nr:UDP-N-acetylmuramoyl-tripeptide--D-alanyl-D-alanine ligase [Candidatus Polarisedimenticolia bacterium]
MTEVRHAAAARPAAEPAMAADEVVRLTAGTLLKRSARAIRGGAVDSRAVQPGEVFVALPGERTDGHRFLGEAAAAGAAALVVTTPPAADVLEAFGDVTVIQVRDGLRALQAIAAGWRSRFSPLVVGITGSIAKTSTKEAIAAVLSTRRVTLKNEGNLNNEIGLPLTLLRLGPEHEAAVLEMGMYVGGEIADLARLARPSIGVVTAVEGVHLSRIGSLDAIEDAKAELVEALPRDGVAVLNADDERVVGMAARTAARPLTYGFAEDADVRADEVRSAGFDGMRFVLQATVAGRAVRQPVAIPGLGRLSIHNALAGAAVGLATGIDPAAVAAGLAAGWSAPHRATIRRVGDIRIVDDSYNASPGSVAAALDLLAGLPGRRVAVLGEMLELGSASDEAHAAVGSAAAATVDLLVVIGAGAAGIAEGASTAGLDSARILRVDDRDAALDALRSRLRPGDVVLVKASRGVALDVLVDDLAAELGERPS